MYTLKVIKYFRNCYCIFFRSKDLQVALLSVFYDHIVTRNFWEFYIRGGLISQKIQPSILQTLNNAKYLYAYSCLFRESTDQLLTVKTKTMKPSLYQT